MFEKHAALFLWTETPLHAGSGSTVGVIDLPIQRNRQTSHPIIQSSGFKGALRDYCRLLWNVPDRGASLPGVPATEDSGEKEDAEPTDTPAGAPPARKSKKRPATSEMQKWEAVFGPEDNPEKFGGAVSFSDANLVLFPVRSLRGVSAWITCPLALARLYRDLARNTELAKDAVPLLRVINALTLSGAKPPIANVSLATGSATTGSVTARSIPLSGAGRALAATGNAVSIEQQYIVLEEYTFQIEKLPILSPPGDLVLELAKWLCDFALPKESAYDFWKERLHTNLVILSDDDFTEFVKSATNVDQRIRIDPDTGTVSKTGLWIEESLPADSLLYSILHAMPPRQGKGAPAELLDTDGSASAGKVRDLILTTLNENPIMQIGGDETVGRGITRVTTMVQKRKPDAKPKESQLIKE